MIEATGWVSSAILVLTIGTQVHKQWKAGTSKGVSKWLFIGQFSASTGFLVYSALIENYVFVVTNGLLALAAVLGLSIVLIHRAREGAMAQKSRGTEPMKAPLGRPPRSEPCR